MTESRPVTASFGPLTSPERVRITMMRDYDDNVGILDTHPTDGAAVHHTAVFNVDGEDAEALTRLEQRLRLRQLPFIALQ